MSNRIMNAVKEYKSKPWKGKKAAFYGRDVSEVIENCGGDASRAIIYALEAGFIIGYRKGQKDAGGK